MSRRRRKHHRREQGHPARIAARRGAESAHARERSPIASMCEALTGLSSAYEAELYASEVLEMPWSERGFEDPDEFEVGLGESLLDDFAAHGGPGALVLLEAVAALASPGLAEYAARLAEPLRHSVKGPEWIDAIGTARAERTAVISESTFDDGRTWFIESVNSHGDRDTVGIYVDHNLGCSAKDILIAPSIEEIRKVYEENPVPGVEMNFEEVDLALAAARIRAAMELTDLTLDPIVSEEYARYRALARHRTDALPAAEPDDGRPEVTPAERDALLSEFLSSPESEAIEPESDAAEIVSSAIDFSADYVDGRPLRWSPVTVEIFMADWLLRKVIADDAYFAAVPDALAAWIRFTGRKRELPPEAVDQVLAAVAEHAKDLEDEVKNPSGERGPAGELIEAIREAGIDPTDEKALDTFIAGWNARSLLD